MPPLIIKPTPQLAFPLGPVDLDKVAKAYVIVPLGLVRYMETQCLAYQAGDTRDEVKASVSESLRAIQDGLVEAIFGGPSSSSGGGSLIRYGPYVRRDASGTPVAVSFSLVRAGCLDNNSHYHTTQVAGPGLVVVRVRCADRACAGKLQCDVIPN